MTTNIIFDGNNQKGNLQTNPSEKAGKSEIGLSPPITELIKNYQEELLSQEKRGFATIHVDEIASKIARIYEKIRKVVDWKEENVLRRSAILRILKRSFISKISGISFTLSTTVGQIAESLTLELIRGGHLPNDTIPVQKIEIVTCVLRKYVYILENASFAPNNTELLFKRKVNFYDWLLEIAACEIEDVLASPFKENALIKSMTLLMSERTKLIPETLTEPEKRTLVYIAVCRTLFDLDDPFITFHMLRYRYPDWLSPSDQFLTKLTKDIFTIVEEIDKELKHPLSRDFFTICEKTDTVFTLLGDFLDYHKNDPKIIPKVITNKNSFKELITQFYNKRMVTLKTRLFRVAIFSTLSVFVSNWFTYFIIEVPMANLFYEGFNFFAALIDFIVPSIAMFVLVAIIRPPARENLNKVIETTFKFVYPEDEGEIYEIKLKKKRIFLFNFIIMSIYLVACLLFFGVVAWIFFLAKIPKTSVVFDTATIAMNVFAALVIRNKSKELTVQEKTSFWEFLLDVVAVPVAQVGNFLSNKWKEYNVITVFFNYFIEMPFVTLVEFVESWSTFLKEKKADIH